MCVIYTLHRNIVRRVGAESGVADSLYKDGAQVLSLSTLKGLISN